MAMDARAPPELYELEKSASPLTICVTGATGFLAGGIIERLLASGHNVRATMRDASQTDRVQHLLDLPGAADRLKLFSADLTTAGSFDEAVAGCDYVLHTASPFILSSVKPHQVKQLLLEPAVKGVENIVAAVNKTTSVKRMVQTSSIGAVYGLFLERGAGHVFTEEDWNTTANEQFMPYFYSKVLAEKRAWELARQQNRWDLVVVNPGMIYGPPPSARQDSESVKFMLQLVGGMCWPAAPPVAPGMVDIRDVAAAHCLAMLHPDAQGRYLCAEGAHTLLEMGQVVETLFPHKYWLPKTTMPVWLFVLLGYLTGDQFVKDSTRNLNVVPQFSSSKIQRELGLKFTPHETTLRDMVLRLAHLGLLQKPS